MTGDHERMQKLFDEVRKAELASDCLEPLAAMHEITVHEPDLDYYLEAAGKIFSTIIHIEEEEIPND